MGAAVKRLKKSIARLIAALEKELAELDKDIDDAVRGSPVWREKEELLASVPGVGSIIARTLMAELPELGTLDRKKIASLAGLAPYTRQSGNWKGRSMIGGGRKTQIGCHHRRRQKAAHNPQRHPQRQNPMANRLTDKTVASLALAVLALAGDDNVFYFFIGAIMIVADAVAITLPASVASVASRKLICRPRLMTRASAM
jgi:transposase